MRPVCPTCRAHNRPASVLRLDTVSKQRDGEVIEGVLLCPAPTCNREHPIIDGIPIIVADIRAQMVSQANHIMWRDDLSSHMESLLADCLGPESEFERNRYHLSTYCRSHYGDQDPEHPMPQEHGLAALWRRGVNMLSYLPQSEGVWLDVGCSVGRASFEMAALTGDLVLGIDLNMGMLRTARSVAQTGRVRHPLRRGGIVYERREFDVDLPARDRVEFWACDAMALPFANDRFAGALSFNITDCVPSPVAHLMEVGRVLAPEAQAIVTTPYDWSSNATPMEAWIGGHSQRSDNHGDSVREMHRVISANAPAAMNTRMVIADEAKNVPWHVYVHERATMTYRVHVVVTRKPTVID